MKSKITIDVDYDNQPIIKIEYVASDDVRDKLVFKFINSLGYQSVWTKFDGMEHSIDWDLEGDYKQAKDVYKLRPIEDWKLYDEKEEMNEIIERYELFPPKKDWENDSKEKQAVIS